MISSDKNQTRDAKKHALLLFDVRVFFTLVSIQISAFNTIHLAFKLYRMAVCQNYGRSNVIKFPHILDDPVWQKFLTYYINFRHSIYYYAAFIVSPLLCIHPLVFSKWKPNYYVGLVKLWNEHFMPSENMLNRKRNFAISSCLRRAKISAIKMSFVLGEMYLICIYLIC